VSQYDDEAVIIRGRYKTWGEPYNAALARGHDHGSAAYIADQWEARQTARGRKAARRALGGE